MFEHLQAGATGVLRRTVEFPLLTPDEGPLQLPATYRLGDEDEGARYLDVRLSVLCDPVHIDSP